MSQELIITDTIINGCASVSIGVKSKGSIKITPFASNSSYEIDLVKSQIKTKIINDNSKVQINNIKHNTKIETKHKNDTQISYGLVCGTDIGANVLYASDGALITIDGEYLIVQKE